jgi:Fur family transcriptional regulator, ferric uptake regulator
MGEGRLQDEVAHLRARGYRVTAQRRAIIAALREAGRYCTAAQLFARLPEQRGDPISVSSVYRTLEVLADLGLAERRAEPSGEASFLYCSPGHHHHVICTACGAVREIDACPDEELARRVERATHFRVERHTLDFYGRCGDCRPRE